MPTEAEMADVLDEKRQKYREIVDIIMSLSEMYNKKVPSRYVLMIYWQALKHFEIAAIRQALTAHVMNPDSGQFMPKPADVVKMLGGTTTDKALIAWSMVDQAVRGIGPWDSVVFADPIIHTVIADMGGWILLCSKGDRQWQQTENEFVTRYRGALITPSRQPHPPMLPGQIALNNQRLGFPVPPPRVVGDLEKARQVMLSGSEGRSPIAPAGTYLGNVPQVLGNPKALPDGQSV